MRKRYLFAKQSQILTSLMEKTFENIVGKGENTGHQYFLFSHNVTHCIRDKFRFLNRLNFVVCTCFQIRKLPNDKILDTNKLKAFADDKTNAAQMIISVFDRLENIAGKGENAGYQHFLLFPQCFQKASFLGALESLEALNVVKH